MFDGKDDLSQELVVGRAHLQLIPKDVHNQFHETQHTTQSPCYFRSELGMMPWHNLKGMIALQSSAYAIGELLGVVCISLG